MCKPLPTSQAGWLVGSEPQARPDVSLLTPLSMMPLSTPLLRLMHGCAHRHSGTQALRYSEQQNSRTAEQQNSRTAEQQNSRTAEQRNVIVADAVKHPPPPSLSPWERARLRRTTLHRQKTPESNKGSGVWTLLPLCLKAIERIQTALETASHPPHYVHLTAELYTTFITKTHPLYPKNNRGSEVSLPCPCSKQ